jgi:hypothetical protein
VIFYPLFFAYFYSYALILTVVFVSARKSFFILLILLLLLLLATDFFNFSLWIAWCQIILASMRRKSWITINYQHSIIISLCCSWWLISRISEWILWLIRIYTLCNQNLLLFRPLTLHKLPISLFLICYCHIIVTIILIINTLYFFVWLLLFLLVIHKMIQLIF